MPATAEGNCSFRRNTTDIGRLQAKWPDFGDVCNGVRACLRLARASSAHLFVCPSMAASRARSAGESVSRAAASFASGSPGPVPSLGPLCPASEGMAFAVSLSLVQTLVQTAEGVGASPLSVSLTTATLTLPKLDVAGSNPVSRSCQNMNGGKELRLRFGNRIVRRNGCLHLSGRSLKKGFPPGC